MTVTCGPGGIGWVVAVTCGPGGIGWVDGSHVWTRWYRVGGGIGWVGDSHVWTRWYRVGGWKSRVDQVV